jgi:hypothetical protein
VVEWLQGDLGAPTAISFLRELVAYEPLDQWPLAEVSAALLLALFVGLTVR